MRIDGTENRFDSRTHNPAGKIVPEEPAENCGKSGFRTQTESALVIITGSCIVLLEELNGALNNQQREYIKRILDNARILESLMQSEAKVESAQSSG